jgi:hypothetical protein
MVARQMANDDAVAREEIAAFISDPATIPLLLAHPHLDPEGLEILGLAVRYQTRCGVLALHAVSAPIAQRPSLPGHP